MVKRVQTRIHCCLGQRDATRVCSVCENDFIPLDGGNRVIETRHRPATEKRTCGLWRIKYRGLDFVLSRDATHQTFAQYFVVQYAVQIKVVILEVDGLQSGHDP